MKEAMNFRDLIFFKMLIVIWKEMYNKKTHSCDHSTTPLTFDEMKNSKLRVTMVSWTADDHHVITAVSDYSIKLWDSHTGKLVQMLEVRHNPG